MPTTPIRAKLERYLRGAWYRPKAPGWLLPAAWMYGRIMAGRSFRPAADGLGPVIVVGNLVAGGTGKTPVVAALVHAIARTGRRVAVISRGYGGRRHDAPILVEPDLDAAEVGDEPLELARGTGVPVWVCVQRASALAAARAAGAEVVISDDGLQHLELPRSLEICVLDGRRGFGNGRLIPAGPLRQSIGRLDSVDVVLARKPIEFDHPALANAFGFSLRAGALESVVPGSAVPMPPAEIDAVAGIADPERFFGILEERGYRLRRHALADHQPIEPGWLAGLPGPLVMTGKDRARLAGPPSRDDLFVLPVSAELPEAVVDRALAHVRKWHP